MNHKIIPHIRAIRKLTQADMARQLGIGRSALAQWEQGRTPLILLHELAFRQLAGDEDYYIAARRAAEGTAPTGNRWRGHL